MDVSQEKTDSFLKRVEAELQAVKTDITEEIRRYPAPIPACDAQFNYLLEKRDRVIEELGRLHAIAREEGCADRQFDALRAFTASSQSLSPAAKERCSQ